MCIESNDYVINFLENDFCQQWIKFQPHASADCLQPRGQSITVFVGHNMGQRALTILLVNKHGYRISDWQINSPKSF